VIWVNLPQSNFYVGVARTIYYAPCSNSIEPDKYLQADKPLQVDGLSIEEIMEQL